MSSRGLGDVYKRQKANEVEKYLEDSDPEVVMSSCFYLGYLGAREYIPRLEALLSDNNDQIVNMCASGLSLMVNKNDTYLLPKLHALLEHDFDLVQISAIEAIGQIGSKDSVNFLLEGFESASSGKQGRIVQSLGKIGSADTLPFLEKYLQKIIDMDHSAPNKGGMRGSNLHPDTLQEITEKAIQKIKSKNA
mgnify:CR=1 FL=1